MTDLGEFVSSDLMKFVLPVTSFIISVSLSIVLYLMVYEIVCQELNGIETFLFRL